MYNYSTIDQSNIEYLEIAPASELPPGQRLFVEIEGKPIVIFNIAGQYFSIADVCSHDDGPVGEGNIEGYNITCPRHGATSPPLLALATYTLLFTLFRPPQTLFVAGLAIRGSAGNTSVPSNRESVRKFPSVDTV